MPNLPPRSNAWYWEKWYPRKEAVKSLKEDKLAEWKRIRVYHKRSLTETAIFRYKQLLSSKLTLRN
ncbi:Mobile element protein [Candidatus Enterovibrio escicola]|uniref:Mobile element protein n=1 Tax=Candidatus Enterovibrio escicola TaxID=1927127 RepID=A0A2A5SZ30_9GAMM|nr:Mobile element protein [Candidatus Enterovibrio escacola]